MFKKLVSTIVAGIGPTNSSAAQFLHIGSAAINAPDGWRPVEKSDEKLILRAANGKQQATITLLRLSAEATFDQFKRILPASL